MRSLPRILLASCLAAALILAVACGGSGGNGSSNGGGDGSSNEPLGDTSELLVANPSEALGRSVDRFEQDVQSVSAEFFFEMDVSGFTVGADGTFGYRAPDSMYMVMDMNGGGEGLDFGELGEFEILLLGEDFYMNSGFTGWVKMSLDDLGADGDSLKQLLEGHAPLNYEQLINDLEGEVQNLGDVTIDGTTYSKMRITTDFEKLMGSIANSVGDSGLDTSAFGGDVSGLMTIDILIDKVTLLPYTFDANGQFGMAGETMNFAMNFKFFGYNGPVNIPAAPADAQSFEDGFGDPFAELTAGE
jgi:hypothetical protein